MTQKVTQKRSASNQKDIAIYCILDRSGSMAGAEKGTIDGYNDFISRQKKELPNGSVTLVLFDDKYEVVYKDKELSEVEKLDGDTYFVRGWTALNDAVGKTLTDAESRYKSQGRPDKSICLIVTDGYENYSTEYPGEEGRKKVKAMIERLEKDEDWTFFFIGAEMDAVVAGQMIGIQVNNIAQVHKDYQSSRAAYAAMSSGTSAAAGGGTVASTQDLYDDAKNLWYDVDEEDSGIPAK